MTLLSIGLLGITLLALGYRFYGVWVARVFALDPKRLTPACRINDGQDFVPARPVMLLGQHFSAIAAVGPIAGPILAAGKYGWLPSFLWIILGAIFIGAVHDFSALIASVRHGGRSMAEVIGIHIGPTAKKLFLVFIWLSLLYVILVFTDLTASAFLSRPELGAQNFGPGVAASSLFYLALAAAMGILLRSTKIPLSAVTIGGVLLLLVLIRLGQHVPLALSAKSWQMLILTYCFVASLIPVWLLLQSRGYLGGFLLYASLAAGVVGILFYPIPIAAPEIVTGEHSGISFGAGMFPLLFTTIACGACSGFHGLVASGTTSKQIAREPDARLVGYGGMLLESFVALVALSAFLAMAAQGQGQQASPDEIYARGLATFLTIAGVPFETGVSFGKLAFATFIYDTLDVASRLGRYIFQELTGWHDQKGKYLGAFLTLAPPAVILLLTPEEAPPAWKSYWATFGASNQLLACLTLAGITVWLKKEGRNFWVTAIPAIFMAIVTFSTLGSRAALWMLARQAPSAAGITELVILGAAVAILYAAVKTFFNKAAHEAAK
ncbi:MAG: carbon starvation protein A [Elusimicrobia bacterium]|nr:carbon starvation protein A [Elusimicrobiota bacterium]